MFEKVILTVDFSPFTERLLGCVEEFARVGMKEIVLLHVLDDAERRDEVKARLESLAEEPRRTGIAVRTIVETGDPAPMILDVAQRESAAFIFMGAHGHSLTNRRLLGHVTEAVLKQADRPVMVQQCRIIQQGEGYTCETACDRILRHALVASDFSAYFESLRPVLEEFAESFRMPLTLLHVQPIRHSFFLEAARQSLRGKAKRNLKRLAELRGCLEEYCPRFHTDLVDGDPADRIREMAFELDASLIVVGAFGRGGVLTGSIGNVARKVVQDSDIPVLVLRTGK